MKKILLFLLLGLLPQLIHAQTAKAIWCSGNTTLYFTYDTNTYAAGGTYEGQTITDVYTINANGYINLWNIPWYSVRKSVTQVEIASNFTAFIPTSLAYWFSDFTELTTVTGEEFLNKSNITSMYYLFENCRNLSSINVSNWDMSEVTNMYGMFSGCSSLSSLDVSNWNVSKVTNMNYMFYGCSSLPSLDVSKWNVSNVTNMNSMFRHCSNLPSLDVSKWKVGNVTNMEGMFAGCSNLPSLDVSKWNVGNVTNMRQMFNGCSNLSSLDVSKWNISNVANMERMFDECSNLLSVDVRNWNTSNVTNMNYMFARCSNLTNLTFGKDFSMDNVTSAREMFGICSKLRYIDFYKSDDTDAITSVVRNGTFDNVFYRTPATTVIYLPHGSQYVTDAQNVVYSYNGDETDLRCPEYYSEDKVDIELPRDFKTHKAIYQRTMANNYGSVILPYDFTTNDYVQAYTLDEEHTETMYFRDTQTVPAHTPFAFNVKQKGSGNVVDFTMADSSNSFGITVKATHTTHPDETGWDGVAGAPYSSNTNLTGWTAKGYYVNQTIEKTDPLYSDLHYIAGEKFYKAAGETLIFPPHRVTFHGTWTKGNTSSGAKSFVFAASDDEVVTAIEEAETRQTLRDAEAIYDLAGRRQHETQKGVNIVRMKDGSVKKVFIK